METSLFIINNNVKRLTSALAVLICSSGISVAQHYYATDKTGELEFINDTQYVISFYGLTNLIFYDTGFYAKNKDTLFLTSSRQFRYSISESFDTAELSEYKATTFLIKRFAYWAGEGKIRLIERIEKKGYRNNDKDIIYSEVEFIPGDILVIYDNWIYRRFKVSEECILNYNPRLTRTLSAGWIEIERDKEDRIYLDHFPLLIRKGKLIPIDKEMVYSCYLLNGFVFPTMDTKPRQLRKRCVLYRGNSDSADLLFPEEITIPQ